MNGDCDTNRMPGTDEELFKRVLDEFNFGGWESRRALTQDIRDRLEQPKQEPLTDEWVGLTGDEVNEFAAGCHLGFSVQGAIRKAEASLKEKNTRN